MKCIVCGREVSGRSKCPDCGFTVYYIPGQKTEEIKNKIEALAQKYRRKKRDQFSVSLYTRTYGMEQDQLRVKEEEWLPLMAGSELESGKEKWLDRPFARQRLDQPVCLKIKLKWFEEEKVETVEIKPPIIFDFWRVGIKRKDENHIQILLGRKDCFESSDEISIF